MKSRASRQILRGIFLGVALALSFAPSAARAQDATPTEAVATLPVPRVVIYPGDTIRDDMLMDVPANEAQGVIGSSIQIRSALVGKMARRTLLPGRAVSSIAISNARAVANGAEVRLVYSDGGLEIFASASALQDGAVGDVIKVRNADSGLTVSGVIQPDGSVRVSGG
jgi:flagellar basal body P-ring formation protein FlgA